MGLAHSVIIALLQLPPLLNSLVLLGPFQIALQSTMPRNASVALPAITAWLAAALILLHPALRELTPPIIRRNLRRHVSSLLRDTTHSQQLKPQLLAGRDIILVLGNLPVQFAL